MNAPSKIHRPEFNLEPGTYIPLIFSKPIYHPDQRSLIKGRLLFIKDDYDIGIPRLHAFIVSTVDQNKKRIRRPNGAIGIHVDQLSEKNLYHCLFENRRTDDSRMEILDCFLQIFDEDPPDFRLMI